MDRVPLEVIYRHSFRTVSDFFAEKVEKERREGKVAILVEDFTTSLYFMKCDEHGYPDYHRLNFMTFDISSISIMDVGHNIAAPMTQSVEEVSVMIEKPMLTQRYGWEDKPYVFMWSGKIMSKRKIPLEKLNVSELMKLAQQAIKNREGLVIDEAMKNKLYK